jgi:membrane protein implicated in regulation of membrane protease activity
MNELGAIDPRWAWALAAVVLAAAEMVVPGVFLIWLAIAAAVAGIVAWLFDPPIAVDLGVFAAAAIASIYAGRIVYRGGANPPHPLLNDRSARLIGTRVVIAEDIADGRGRALVGDGSWPVSGPDMAKGATATVIGIDGNTLLVEPSI